MKFIWDEYKNAANQLKHKISFEEAKWIFNGTEEIEYDHDHSSPFEDRYKAFGILPKHGAVIVVFVNITDDVIRIISAFKN